jgi:tetratricopeptide (TPR) repeat protein
MLYAKTLLLNRKFRQADSALSTLSIIPFEGATEGRELYREAKLMQALQELKKKNYANTLAMVQQAKLWPENLGVGKPYDEDIDVRFEEWMSYLAHVNMKNTEDGRRSLEKISAFTRSLNNPSVKYFAANHLLTAWAMEKQGHRSDALKWLDSQIQKDPRNKVLLWCKYAFENNHRAVPDINDQGTRLLMQLMQTLRQ